MILNSYIFIILFLPVTLILYFIIGEKGKSSKYSFANLILLFASIVFYLYFDYKCFFVLFALAIFNYYSAKSCTKNVQLTFSIVVNVAVLCFFKYVNMFSDCLASLCKNDKLMVFVIMPLGISFFVFQQIAYLVDSYRNDGVSEHSFLDYLLFSFFFPCITSGPICYFSELVPQFKDSEKKKVNYENICRGLYLMSLGLGKKVLIADTLAGAVANGYDGILYGFKAINAWVLILSYSLQIYFDFSGYSDMAIGVAKMFNIDLPINFNSPYKSYNITDFWNRWHITLTRFLTKYIYIPLGGNRKGKIRTYINIMIVFIISGLWHGATLNFFIWGMLHGILSVGYRLIKKIYDGLHPVACWIFNFASISLAWVYFGAPSRGDANTIVVKALTPEFDDINNIMADSFVGTTMRALTMIIRKRDIIDSDRIYALVAFLFISIFIVLCTENNMIIVKNGFEYKFRHAVITVLVLAVSIVSLSGVSLFVYNMF